MCDDILGDLGEQLVALGVAQLPAPHGEVEQDLQVDLVVRAVDARRVVDEVGVDQPALAAVAADVGVLDARAMGEAEVAALPHDPRPDLATIDADRIA